MPHLLADFIPLTLGLRGLVGVPPAIAEEAVRQAAIDLCDRGAVWEFRLTLQTQPRVHQYPLLIPEASNVTGIKSVTTAMSGRRNTPPNVAFRGAKVNDHPTGCQAPLEMSAVCPQ